MFYGRKDGERVDWVGIETDEDKPVGYENPFTTEASEKEWKRSKTKNNIKKREREGKEELLAVAIGSSCSCPLKFTNRWI